MYIHVRTRGHVSAFSLHEKLSPLLRDSKETMKLIWYVRTYSYLHELMQSLQFLFKLYPSSQKNIILQGIHVNIHHTREKKSDIF